MNDYIIYLHHLALRMDMIGCWGIAEDLRKMILKEVENEKNNDR